MKIKFVDLKKYYDTEYVYFINKFDKDTGEYVKTKLGKTNDLRKRFTEHRHKCYKNGFNTELIHAIECNYKNSLEIERFFKRKFNLVELETKPEKAKIIKQKGYLKDYLKRLTQEQYVLNKKAMKHIKSRKCRQELIEHLKEVNISKNN